jgi:hypothetical protein
MQQVCILPLKCMDLYLLMRDGDGGQAEPDPGQQLTPR